MDHERKIALLEKRLQEEREKVLLANLKFKEEEEISSRVEVSIREVQDKLRRDRREADMEETRLKLEARIQELENRLVQERETWVSTLKGQVQSRDLQDRDVESQFTQRIQEIERRWLEEKAYWQKMIRAKEDEARAAAGALERSKGLEIELQKTVHEKKFLEERISQMSMANGQLQAQAAAYAERDRECFRVKADLERSQDQLRMMQDRFDRELQSARASAKDREDRLLADLERLQKEQADLAQRVRAEAEVELRRVKAESEAELRKAKAQTDLAGAALQRMRAVAGALEKQTATMRAQFEEAKRIKEEFQKLNERYKAEFVVLQRKWMDREADVRKSAQAEAGKLFEAEKARLRLKAHEEIQNQILKVQGQFQDQMAREAAEIQRRARAAAEEELSKRVDAEKERLSAEARRSEEARRQMEAELGRRAQEFAALRQSLDEMRGRAALEEERNASASRERVQAEKTLVALHEQIRRLESALGEAESRVSAEERRFAAVCAERENWVRVRGALEAREREGAQEIERLKARLAEIEGGGASGPGGIR
jgi:hypothetical protein